VSEDWGAYRLTSRQLMSSGGNHLGWAGEEGAGELLGGVMAWGVNAEDY